MSHVVDIDKNLSKLYLYRSYTNLCSLFSSVSCLAFPMREYIHDVNCIQ